MIQPNGLSALFVAIYLLQMILSAWMETANQRHQRRHGGIVPGSLSSFVDLDTLSRMSRYAAEKNRLGVIRGVSSGIVLLALLLGGVLQDLNRHLVHGVLGEVGGGLGFFLILGALFLILDLPFDYFETFSIEERYGFNRSTRRIWMADLLKSVMISAVFLAALSGALLWLVRAFPGTWWILGFALILLAQIVVVTIYPVAISPLFNKFEPLEDRALAGRVEKLMKSAGVRTKGVFRMDAARRSRHTNAYLAGLGKTKRIVLFDTLLETHPRHEILAVLAHEIGHFKGRHLLKQMILAAPSMLATLYLSHLVLRWDHLYATFGFLPPSASAGLLLAGLFLQKAGFFLKPLPMALSRRYEREADEYAARLLGGGEGLAEALKRMAAHNLASLHPHPLYAWFHFAHPPIVERIARLESA